MNIREITISRILGMKKNFEESHYFEVHYIEVLL